MNLERLKYTTLISLILFGLLIFWLTAAYVLFFRHPVPVEIQTIAYEASNQSLRGQIAVASVIKTRMAQRHQTAQEVVLSAYQFSCWHPQTHEPTQSRLLSREDIKMARKSWLLAQPDAFNHYCRYNIRPHWTTAAKNQKRIGDHVFYEL